MTFLPDVVGFDARDLRPHFDWFDDKWVRPLVEQAELNSDKGNEKDTFSVKYQNSGNSDNSGMVKINIGTPHILPSAHLADRDYELLEKVDVRYGLGWRTGTITKIFEGRRYNVYFRQGNEDRKLDHSELRPHLEWADGQTKGTNVPDHQEHLGEVCEGSDNPEMVMQLESLGASVDNAKDKTPTSTSLGNIMEQTVDCSENVSNNNEMKLLTTCDNSMPSCTSKMSTEKDIVEVPLSVQLQKTPVEKTAKKEIFVITPTTRGKGTQHSRKHVLGDQPSAQPDSLSGDGAVMNIPDHQEHIGEACEGSDNAEVVMRLESFGASGDNAKDKTPTSTSLGNIMEQSADCSENVPNNKKMKLLTMCDNSIPSCTPKMSTERDIVEVPLSVQLQKTPVEKTTKQEICMITPTTGGKGTKHSQKHVLGDQLSAKPDSLSGVEIVVTRKGRAVKSAFRSSFHLTTVMERKVVDVATPNINACQGGLEVAEVPVIFGLQDKEFNQQTAGGSIQKRKRGRPPKLAVPIPKASVAGKDQCGGEIANEMDVKNQPINQVELPTCTTVDPTARDGTCEASETDCKIKEVDMAIAVASKNVTDDDQPLSIMFGEMHCSAGDSRTSSGNPANGWNETNERSADGAVKSSPKDVSSSGVPVNDLRLPFVRRSPVWKTIESMEAFQIVPQQPHFHPLAECKEDYREGFAIGYMITFSSLFEKISSLQFKDPRSTLESILESLLDLQKQGFDVTLLQDRVNELLSIKETRQELASQLKDAEREMREQADGKRELQGKINEIEKKIAELQEELTASNSEMEATDLEIARSSAKLDVINLRINNVRHDFEAAATAPWKSP